MQTTHHSIEKIDTHIEIVGSTNSRLTAMSASSRQTILAILKRHYTHVSTSIVNNMDDLEALVAKKPDLVLLGMKLILLDETKSYDESPKLWLSTYLKANDINFTGSNSAALTLEFDKPKAKQNVLDSGLNTSAYFKVKIHDSVPQHALTFPLFVKPSNCAGSNGIDQMSIVHDNTALSAKVASIHHELSSDALVEEYLPGREFSVGIVRQPDQTSLLAMPIEITAPPDEKGNRFLSETVKTEDTEIVTAVHDPVLKAKLCELGTAIFESLGASDYGRIDLRLDRFDNPSFIEANLMPGLSSHGYLSRCASLNTQLSHEDILLSIVNLGLKNTPCALQTTTANA
jgi:D-alanine-D-alanine ligase